MVLPVIDAKRNLKVKSKEVFMTHNARAIIAFFVSIVCPQETFHCVSTFTLKCIVKLHKMQQSFDSA